jgi:hypothetical protein
MVDPTLKALPPPWLVDKECLKKIGGLVGSARIEELVEPLGKLGARRDSAGDDSLEEAYKRCSMTFAFVSLPEEDPTCLSGPVSPPVFDMLSQADGSPYEERRKFYCGDLIINRVGLRRISKPIVI